MLNPILELSSSDVKLMVKKLREIEPNLVKEYRKEINKIAKPVAEDIQRRIPNEPPLSGMGFAVSRTSVRTGITSYYINEGRLNWKGTGKFGDALRGKGKGPKSVSISNAIKASGRSLTTPIAKVIINSPAVSMADMAGRKGSGNSGTRSRSYTYRLRDGSVVTRRHRVNGQGRTMIEQLNSRYGRASRFGWAALEGRIDSVAREIDKVLQKYFDRAFGKN
jgi:hypothetical protein